MWAGGGPFGSLSAGGLREEGVIPEIKSVRFYQVGGDTEWRTEPKTLDPMAQGMNLGKCLPLASMLSPSISLTDIFFKLLRNYRYGTYVCRLGDPVTVSQAPSAQNPCAILQPQPHTPQLQDVCPHLCLSPPLRNPTPHPCSILALASKEFPSATAAEPW